MPNLNVKPRIDNKGIKSPLRSPLMSPKIVNKALPNFSLVSPKIDNKGLNIVKHEINKIKSLEKSKLKLKDMNSEKDLVQKKNNGNFDSKIPETLITPPTPVKNVQLDDKNYVLKDEKELLLYEYAYTDELINTKEHIEKHEHGTEFRKM